jgi:hypothetical protein
VENLFLYFLFQLKLLLFLGLQILNVAEKNVFVLTIILVYFLINYHGSCSRMVIVLMLLIDHRASLLILLILVLKIFLLFYYWNRILFIILVISLSLVFIWIWIHDRRGIAKFILSNYTSCLNLLVVFIFTWTFLDQHKFAGRMISLLSLPILLYLSHWASD